MTVFEKGTYMTVGELKARLDHFEDDVPVCHFYDGRAPLVGVVPSFGASDDKVIVLALHLATIDDHVEVDFT